MGLCATMTGFFLKKECGDVCGQKCSRCYKFVCSRHQAANVKAILCLECDARARQGEYDPSNPSYAYNNNDYFLYRNYFYASQAFNPLNADGSDYYSTFDAMNATEFDVPGGKYDDPDDEELDVYAS